MKLLCWLGIHKLVYASMFGFWAPPPFTFAFGKECTRCKRRFIEKALSGDYSQDTYNKIQRWLKEGRKGE